MSACGGDTGGAASTQGPVQGTPCDGTMPFGQCTCATGGPGYQTCQGGVWSPCTCNGGPGAGGSGVGGGVNPPPGGSVGTLCGNGVIDVGEQSDGQQQGGESCMTFTMGACTGGFLSCNGSCMFDTS